MSIMDERNHLPESRSRQGESKGPREASPVGAVNYYRVLDVDPGASRLQIREAYLRLKGTFSAGSSALYSLISEEEASEQLALVEEAFRVLENELTRRDYDQSLARDRWQARQGAARFDGSDLGTESGGEPHGFHGGFAAESSTIRTTRSTLPVIKLRANGANLPEAKAKLAEIVAAGPLGDGDLFRRLREGLGVSEEEICERTKVTITYIQAIESNRFDRLPQAVYVKGFLRSYLRYLDMPVSEELVAGFADRLAEWQANHKS